MSDSSEPCKDCPDGAMCCRHATKSVKKERSSQTPTESTAGCEGGSCDGEYNGPESEANYAVWCEKHEAERDGELPPMNEPHIDWVEDGTGIAPTVVAATMRDASTAGIEDARVESLRHDFESSLSPHEISGAPATTRPYPFGSGVEADQRSTRPDIGAPLGSAEPPRPNQEGVDAAGERIPIQQSNLPEQCSRCADDLDAAGKCAGYCTENRESPLVARRHDEVGVNLRNSIERSAAQRERERIVAWLRSIDPTGANTNRWMADAIEGEWSGLATFGCEATND